MRTPDTLSEEDSRAACQRYDRAPLLFIGGGKDHVIPAKVSRTMAAKYQKSNAMTDYKEFPTRSHFTAGEPGWEEVADFALSWATEHANREAKATT
jgi:alpha-beta hydrolase superfamily lysophospholipase